MKLHFAKMEAAGNDFVVIDGFAHTAESITDSVANICDRKVGVGADGLVLLNRTDSASVFKVQYFNGDGSRAALCINAFRCAARRVVDLGWQKEVVLLATDIGQLPVTVAGADVHITVPSPRSREVRLPAWASEPNGHYVSTGDPHLVVLLSRGTAATDAFVDDAHRLRWWRGIAGDGQNVHFVERREDAWSIRSYERGVEGETLACGSGVLAAASVLSNLHDSSGTIVFRTYGGGVLKARPRRGDWIISGPARHVFEGRITY